MPALLVSVRSAAEARLAVDGGAAVIDVKEPARGSLGRADGSTLLDVIRVVDRRRPVSAALGELTDPLPSDEDLPAGLSFRKIGLADAPRDWADRWTRLITLSPGAPWVAVIYADFERAKAPHPDSVLDAALRRTECVGVLIDTRFKDRPSPLGPDWRPIVDRVRLSGRFAALAGGLDESAIRRLLSLRPDLFAVRGAACAGGDRSGTIDADLVARLVAASEPDAGPLHPALVRI